jgi:selenide,water dikinase
MDPPPAARLLVVLDRSVAVYSGMVPGYVAGEYSDADLEIDVLPLARRAGAGVLLTPATDIDPVRREIALEGRPPIRYDLASLDVGSTVRGLTLPGVREHALATRPIGHFVRRVTQQLPPLSQLGRPPKIAVIGGGAAGCEIAFALDTRLRRAGLEPQIRIVTSEPEFLSGASPRMRAALSQEALARKIEGLFRRRVLSVNQNEFVTISAESPNTGAPPTQIHAADLIVWATGAAPISFPRHEGVGRLATDEYGFLEVRNTLQSVGFDDVFAVGDCARLVDARWIPKAGVYAVRQGPILEHNLRAAIMGKPMTPYRPQRDFLSLLNLGGGRALGAKWGWAVSGPSVYRLKDRIDRRFIDRFQMLDADGQPRPKNAQLGAMGSQGADEEMACGGCAAKLGASPLAAALAALPLAPADDSVILGLDARDDVAATRTSDPEGMTTLHNIDVIRSFSDDPWLVGRVATSNALSDLHAKGGRPRHAQAIIGLPDLPPAPAQELLFQTLSGVRSLLDPLGVSLLGGHTTIGDVLTVGLSVSGEGPNEDALLRQSGALPGDVLLLTQPLGTGVLLAADMQGLARGTWIEAAHRSMQHTNDQAGRIALDLRAHAATDVTGFGFAGHLRTLLDDTSIVARIRRESIPLLPGARALWESGLRSTAHPHNRAAFVPSISGATEFDEAWLFDPQTAGGMLLAVSPSQTKVIEKRFVEAGEDQPVSVGEIIAASDSSGQPQCRIEVVD